MHLRNTQIPWNFEVLPDGLVHARPVEESAGFETVLLRLSGPTGARVERISRSADLAKLRFGGLTPGWWTAGAEALDPSGTPAWEAPEVRFRANAQGSAQITLQFLRRRVIS